jgi:carbonic anhydrase
MRRFSTVAFVAALALCWADSAVIGQQIEISPSAAFQKLADGNSRFADDRPAAKDFSSKRRLELAQGQRPFAAVLTCADSRVVPEVIFDQGLGDLFVVRVAGNIAAPDGIGSIEYAAEHLHVPFVIVLGHESCGAVEAALQGKPLPGALGGLVAQVHTGGQETRDRPGLDAAIRANAIYQAAELSRRSPQLRQLVETQRLQIAPAVYSLRTGKVEWLKPKGKP